MYDDPSPYTLTVVKTYFDNNRACLAAMKTWYIAIEQGFSTFLSLRGTSYPLPSEKSNARMSKLLSKHLFKFTVAYAFQIFLNVF